MPLRILTVCTANVCRSPVAHALLAVGLPDAEVTSAGTDALVGESMDPRSRGALAQRGIEFDGFRASQLSEPRIAPVDLVLTAALEHRDRAIRLSPRALKRAFTLLEFATLAEQVEAAEDPVDLIRRAVRSRSTFTGPFDIADPVGADPAGYDTVMAELDEVTRRIVRSLAGAGSGTG